ncbi:uncharacterized protein VTP21DRAFT_6430 [Calcarisporiella thermophila]|uniref:uncharacterized protein n=1 Tax=Calcarisporiella thermophila TaxID=911321 RepID=UPI003741F0E4
MLFPNSYTRLGAHRPLFARCIVALPLFLIISQAIADISNDSSLIPGPRIDPCLVANDASLFLVGGHPAPEKPAVMEAKLPFSTGILPWVEIPTSVVEMDRVSRGACIALDGQLVVLSEEDPKSWGQKMDAEKNKPNAIKAADSLARPIAGLSRLLMLEILDLDSRTWRLLLPNGPWPTLRPHSALAELSSHLFFYSYANQPGSLPETYLLRTKDWAWELIPTQAFTPALLHPSIVVQGSLCLVFGSRREESGGGWVNVVHVFNPRSLTWSPRAFTLPTKYEAIYAAAHEDQIFYVPRNASNSAPPARVWRVPVDSTGSPTPSEISSFDAELPLESYNTAVLADRYLVMYGSGEQGRGEIRAFDMKARAWTKRLGALAPEDDPALAPISNPAKSSASQGQPPPERNPGGIIAGAVVAAAVVALGALGAFLYARRRRERKEEWGCMPGFCFESTRENGPPKSFPSSLEEATGSEKPESGGDSGTNLHLLPQPLDPSAQRKAEHRIRSRFKEILSEAHLSCHSADTL